MLLLLAVSWKVLGRLQLFKLRELSGIKKLAEQFVTISMRRFAQVQLSPPVSSMFHLQTFLFIQIAASGTKACSILNKPICFPLQVGFLKTQHRYEIVFTLPEVPALGKYVCPAPVPSPHLRITDITPALEGKQTKSPFVPVSAGCVFGFF